ncbi:MAG TPA: glycosyltransferase family 9 protein, partial [Pedobacter sp.]|nr:glycosyltransferase family 9 protein [Pedobacter sp.]
LSHQLVHNRKEIPVGAIDLVQDHKQQLIGISPFAQHHYKLYPLAKMEVVVGSLAKLGYQIFIFGGGDREQDLAERWQNQFPNVKNLIGKFTLKEELAIISHLDLMLSMDSAGMHMASLMGVPVVSIWGPTHPYAGFLGYGQQLEDCIQIDHPARPSSIYGNKPCLCGSEPCIELIEPIVVINKIQEKLSYG